jgi:hypothetical protein
VNTKSLLQLLARLALCAAIVGAVWGGLNTLEVASRTEIDATASTEAALANLAKVPVAAPLVLQLTVLLRGR